MRVRKWVSDYTDYLRSVGHEMEKDGLDLLEQVVIIILGGILGGQALQVANANLSLFSQLLRYGIIMTMGILSLGIIHFWITMSRMKNEET